MLWFGRGTEGEHDCRAAQAQRQLTIASESHQLPLKLHSKHARSPREPISHLETNSNAQFIPATDGPCKGSGPEPFLIFVIAELLDVWTSAGRCRGCKIPQAVPRQSWQQPDQHSPSPRNARCKDVECILFLPGIEAFPLADKLHLYN